MGREKSLTERVADLEETVAQLQKNLGHRAAPARPAPTNQPMAATPVPTKPTPKLVPRPKWWAPSAGFALNGESWLKVLGIGLLLFGVGFLFKFSIDQGWVTESVRVAFGLFIGALLLVLGLFIGKRRQSFSQVLLGGAIAVFYTSGFAAFQFYALISHLVALVFMVGVTLLAFFLALRRGDAPLAIIGTMGGLGTPFLLHDGAGSVPGLVGYTCLVLAGTSAIYFYRGWRSLLGVAAVGGWMVLAVCCLEGNAQPAEVRWVVQGGIFFGWLAFGVLPAIRQVLVARQPERWPQPELSASIADLAKGQAYALVVLTPLVVLGFSGSIWSFTDSTWGWIALGGAALYWTGAEGLRRLEVVGVLAYTHAAVGVLLATLGLCLLLEGDTRFLALAAEAVVLHLVAHRLEDRGTALGGHLLFVAVGWWLVVRLAAAPVAGIAVFNGAALSYLAAIVAAAAISVVVRPRDARLVYRLAAHVALLAWVLKELAILPEGQGYITVTWGLYSIVLLVIGLRKNFNQLVMVAMGTVFLVVGKLFVVDLEKVETIWRILLFLGFGGVFLGLSYFYQKLWKPATPSAGVAKNQLS